MNRIEEAGERYEKKRKQTNILLRIVFGAALLVVVLFQGTYANKYIRYGHNPVRIAVPYFVEDNLHITNASGKYAEKIGGYTYAGKDYQFFVYRVGKNKSPIYYLCAIEATKEEANTFTKKQYTMGGRLHKIKEYNEVDLERILENQRIPEKIDKEYIILLEEKDLPTYPFYIYLGLEILFAVAFACTWFLKVNVSKHIVRTEMENANYELRKEKKKINQSISDEVGKREGMIKHVSYRATTQKEIQDPEIIYQIERALIYGEYIKEGMLEWEERQVVADDTIQAIDEEEKKSPKEQKEAKRIADLVLSYPENKRVSITLFEDKTIQALGSLWEMDDFYFGEIMDALDKINAEGDKE